MEEHTCSIDNFWVKTSTWIRMSAYQGEVIGSIHVGPGYVPGIGPEYGLSGGRRATTTLYPPLSSHVFLSHLPCSIIIPYRLLSLYLNLPGVKAFSEPIARILQYRDRCIPRCFLFYLIFLLVACGYIIFNLGGISPKDSYGWGLAVN